MKTGILVVSFGTTYRDAEEKTIGKLVKSIREENPDCEVYRAYSSDKIRNILYAREGFLIPDIKGTLIQMSAHGVKRVIVMPIYIMDGAETHKLKQVIQECSVLFDSIQMTQVLLKGEEDFRSVAQAVWDSIKEEAAGKTVIFMGHGSEYPTRLGYEKIEEVLREYSKEQIYIATIEGGIGIDDVIRKINWKRYYVRNVHKKVLLVPFVLTAGAHVRKDMVGEGSSFLSKLKSEGYDVEYILKGVGEYRRIRQIYVRYLQEVMETF